MSGVSDKQLQAVEAQYKVYESMIQSMTRQERANPDLLAKMPSRRWVCLDGHLRWSS